MTVYEIPDDNAPTLIGYRRNPIAGTTLLASLTTPITDVLRRKPWATLVRGEGWAIPTRYLDHVEALLTGNNVELFDIDGLPTPAQRRAETGDERAHTRRILDDIHAARDAAVPMPADVRAILTRP